MKLLMLATLSIYGMIGGCNPFSCGKGPMDSGTFGFGAWDYTHLHVTTIDSSLDPATITLTDSDFTAHSRFSYQWPFVETDTILYTDYTVLPNVITKGYGEIVGP